MSAADGRSRQYVCQLVLLAGLCYLLALLLILAGSHTSSSQRSSFMLRFRAPAGSSSSSNCSDTSKTQARSQAPAAYPAAASWPSSLPAAPWPFPGVRGFYSESDVTLAPWCNATFSKKHPLTAADYERSFTPGGACSMPRGLLDALETGSREVTISVVGGSMTHGVKCLDGEHSSCRDKMCENFKCAWPNKMQSRLQQLFPAGRVSVRNKARSGWSYSTWLESGAIDMLVETDVLIIDLQINSQVYSNNPALHMEEADLFVYNVLAAANRQQRPLGILFVESFATCGNLSALCDAHCPDERQGRMHYNFAGPNRTYGWCNKWWTIANVERPIVHHYQLPTVSYREAVWPSLPNPSPLLPCFWNGYSHPDSVSHLLMSDVIAYGLVRALTDTRNRASTCQSQATPSRFHQRLESMRYCTPPATTGGNTSSTLGLRGTYMTPAHPASFQPLGVCGPWSFREDRPGKPGWIFEPRYSKAPNITGLPIMAKPPTTGSTTSIMGGRNSALAAVNDSAGGSASPLKQAPGNVSNSIWFSVTFSNQPQLQVTYLTSYELTGVAELAIYNRTASTNSSALAQYTLDARSRDRYSVPRTTVFVHPSTPGKTRGKHMDRLPAQVQQGEYIIAIRPLNGTNLQGSKFKLLGVSSC